MQGNFIYGVASRGVLGNTYSINRKQKSAWQTYNFAQNDWFEGVFNVFNDLIDSFNQFAIDWCNLY